MKRTGLALLLVLTLVISLTACGGQKAEPRKGNAKSVEATVTPTDVPATPTDAATPTPTTEPDVTPTVEPVTPTPTEPAVVTPTPMGNFKAPEKNCEIAFPTRDLYHYDMDLRLDTDRDTVGGHVVFEFYNDSNDTWDKLCLRDYPSLFTRPREIGYVARDIKGATTVIENVKDGRDGSNLTCVRDEDVSVIWIDLPAPLAPGEKMTLSYDFTTKIPEVDDRFGVTDGLYNVANFFPILAEYTKNGWSHVAYYLMGECFYSEISNFDVRLTVPAGVTVGSTGTEKGCEEGDGTVTYTYYAPAVRDFVFSASKDFKVDTQTHDGVKVNVLYREDDGVAGMDNVLKYTQIAARDALRAFGEAFGKYPYEELDIILTPLSAGGMEYPNLIQIADSMYIYGHVKSVDGSAPYYDLQICVAHEIGHQWFMGIVGSDSGKQPWQDESITSYTEKVFADYVNANGGNMKPPYITIDTPTRFDFTDKVVVQTYRDSELFPINRGVHDYSSDNRYTYSIYVVGEMVIEEMEAVIGRENFYAVLREYVRRNAFSNADPESFFEVLYECAGTDNEELNTIIDVAFDMSIYDQSRLPR
ncbi:MAG: M1 family metallopeptidase [Lachnospiraceae bacterium]|nr:M1 family metallopeptidase [Lachnospiraceae bacterium]